MPPLEHAAPVDRTLRAALRPWALATLDLVFPLRCAVCATVLGERRRDPLCGACWAAIPRLGPPCCVRCGAPDGPGQATALPCPRCLADPPGWDWARAGARYEGVVRDAIHALKFGGRRALAGPLAALVLEQWAPALDVRDAVVVPVPLTRARQRERGFNQAALLGRRLAAGLGVPLRARWLVRRHANRPQSDLGAAERRANVRDAFAADRAVGGLHVIVVDDVLTTGATAAACAGALRAAGAARVGVLAVARVC